MTTQKEVFERLADLANGIQAEASAAARSAFPLDLSDEIVRDAAIDELRARDLYVFETLEDLSNERRVELLNMVCYDDLLTAVKECDEYSFESACAAWEPSDDDVRKLCEERDVDMSGEDDLRRHPVTEIAVRLAFSNNPFEVASLMRELREEFKRAGVSCAQTFKMVV